MDLLTSSIIIIIIIIINLVERIYSISSLCNVYIPTVWSHGHTQDALIVGRRGREREREREQYGIDVNILRNQDI